MQNRKNSVFTRFSRWIACHAGKPSTFALAVVVILVWAFTGPPFGFSDTWQLVINTSTTIITFLMVFLIQNTQNRDTESLQIKLDELIRSIKEARNEVLDLEQLDERDMDEMRDEYLKLALERTR